MTTDKLPEKKREFVTIGICGSILAFLIGGPPEQLAFGWLYFPFRVIPQLTPDWPTLILAVLSTILFVTALHFTIVWFIGEAIPKTYVMPRWRWKSTWSVAALTLLLFVVGIAMVGSSHQLVWLITGRAAVPSEHGRGRRPLIPTLLDVIGQARVAAQLTEQKHMLKSLGLTFQNLAESENGMLPAGGYMTEDGTLMHGWAAMLSGYDYNFGNAYDFRVPWNKPPNDLVYKCQLGLFVNPSLPGPYFDSEGFGLGHIAGNVHVLPIRAMTIPATATSRTRPTEWHPTTTGSSNGIRLSSIGDGVSQTILLGTVSTSFKPWGHPANVRDPHDGINKSPIGFGGPKLWGGAQFLMCDGSVTMISEKADPRILRALATPNGGDSLHQLLRENSLSLRPQ
jgi:hypothetical protein